MEYYSSPPVGGEERRRRYSLDTTSAEAMRVIEQQVGVFSVNLTTLFSSPDHENPDRPVRSILRRTTTLPPATVRETATRPALSCWQSQKAGGTQSVRKMTGWVRLPGVHRWRMPYQLDPSVRA